MTQIMARVMAWFIARVRERVTDIFRDCVTAWVRSQVMFSSGHRFAHG
jgi:hypothetical protein